MTRALMFAIRVYNFKRPSFFDVPYHSALHVLIVMVYAICCSHTFVVIHFDSDIVYCLITVAQTRNLLQFEYCTYTFRSVNPGCVYSVPGDFTGFCCHTNMLCVNLHVF